MNNFSQIFLVVWSRQKKIKESWWALISLESFIISIIQSSLLEPIISALWSNTFFKPVCQTQKLCISAIAKIFRALLKYQVNQIRLARDRYIRLLLDCLGHADFDLPLNVTTIVFDFRKFTIPVCDMFESYVWKDRKPWKISRMWSPRFDGYYSQRNQASQALQTSKMKFLMNE